MYYRRQVTAEQVEMILQAHAERSSLWGVSRIGQRAYGTVVSIVRVTSQKAQQVHNQEVQKLESNELAAGEMWSFVKKAETLLPEKLEVGDLLDWCHLSQVE